ncbi:MAG: PAS domain-containing protein, partial [Leptospiraceae bacterium]|nr:PAS domain-containing protein [Leptospiraceae bacterium]
MTWSLWDLDNKQKRSTFLFRTSISIIAGLLCFFLSKHNISYQSGNFEISIPWSLLFPILISLAYGFPFSLITAIFGGALFPFYIWGGNGWANVLNFIVYTVFYMCIGIVSDYKLKSVRNKDKLIFSSIISLLFFIFLWICFWYLFPLFLKLNPAFWAVNSIQSIDENILIKFYLKDFINFTLLIFYCEILLRLTFIRKFFKLENFYWMRENTKTFLFLNLVSLFVWIIFYSLDKILSPGGNKEYIPLSFLVIFFSGGIVGRFAIFYQENKVKSEENLKVNEKLIHSILKNVPMAIYRSSLDNNLTIEIISPFIQQLTGYPVNEFLGNKKRSLYSIIHPDDLERVKKEISGQLIEKKNFEIEYRIIDNKNNVKWVNDKGIITNNDNEGISFIDGVIEDITFKKNYLLEVEENKNQLSKTVEERTKELKTLNDDLAYALKELKDAQVQLVHSEKMASLGVMTAGVAHELNNPLNFILGGYSGLDMFFKENPEIKDENIPNLLNIIKTGVDRSVQIVRGLNHFSRDNSSLEEDCDIHAIIENSLAILSNKTKDKIEIQFNLSAEPLVIQGNVGKLHQVFLNIFTNSIQAIEKEEGVIKITTSLKNDIAIIEVEDSGSGISPENLNKITDPFFTTKEAGKGTGLGMSIT